MPTPQGPRSSQAYDGIVPGMTWAQFISGFTSRPGSVTNFGGDGNGEPSTLYQSNLPGYGGVVGRNTNGNFYGSNADGSNADPTIGGGTPAYDYATNNLGDGTINQFSEGPNGELVSKNVTQNNDSWWDSTGLPLVVSLAAGAGIAGLASAGIGVADGAAGLANVGTGFASNGLDSAATLAGNPAFAGGAAGGGGGGGGDGDVYGGGGEDVSGDPTITGDGSGGLNGPVPASNPSWYQQVIDAAKQYGFGNGPIGSVQNIINGTGGVGDYLSAASSLQSAGSLASDLGGGSSGTDVSSIPGVSYSNGGGPSGTGISYSDAANSAANNTPYSGNANDGVPSTSGSGANNSLVSGLGGTAGALGKLINGDSLGASDYGSLLSSGGSLLSGILGYKAANNAANSQINAANNSNALAAAIYANNTALQKPFVDGGTSAFQQQSSLNGLNGTAAQTAARNQFTTDPGYQFALDQGNRALQASASAQGGLYSGRAAKDLTNYTQGVAAQQYGNYYNRLQGQATLGQAAASQQAANGNNYTSNVTSNNSAIGNAQAAGSIAGTNAITGAIGSALNTNASNSLLQQLLNNANRSNGYYPIS